MPRIRIRSVLAVIALLATTHAAHAQIGGAGLIERPIDLDQPRKAGTVRGVVYHDLNNSRGMDPGEPGLAGVLVSNGRQIVRTDKQGRYRMPIDERNGGVVFVCKPRGYRAASDANNVPRFYYIHKPEGSPADLEYPGVRATGRLPERINIPLYEWVEPNQTTLALIGDPQPRNVQEIDWMAQRVISEMTDLGVEGVISLGDIVFDDLSLYPRYDQAMSAVGAPIYNVLGNHDLNFDVRTDELSDETWERVYGPANYAFQIGPVHTVVLDNVYYLGEQNDQDYKGHFNDDALTFLRSYMEHVPEHELLVVAFHIPLFDVDNLGEFLNIVGRHPHTLSLSAHWHVQRHLFYGASDGWPQDAGRFERTHVHHHEHDEHEHHSHDVHPHDHASHHHLCHATACGSWWRGLPGADGVPHATMRDGGPIGYSILTVEPDGAYSIDYKAVGRPADEQMHVWIDGPVTVAAISSQELEVVANVWAGSPRDKVEMRVFRTEPGRRPNVTGWLPMAYDERPDPFYVQSKAREDALAATLDPGESPGWRASPRPVDAHHIWSAKLPVGLGVGSYVLAVRWTDMWDREHETRRVLRVDP